MLLALVVGPSVQASTVGLNTAAGDICIEALTTLCPEWQPKQQCQVCAGVHQHALRVAECTPQEIRTFCSLGDTCGTVPLSCAPNCASAIVKQLTQCSASGGGTVTLSAGIYHCNDTAAPDYQPMLHIEGIKNVALIGAAGSGKFNSASPDPTATTLLFHGMKAAFEIGSSSNIKVQNIQIDMVRQPYTFGKATAVTATSFTLECACSWHYCVHTRSLRSPCASEPLNRCFATPRREQSTQRHTHFRHLSQTTCSRSKQSWGSTHIIGEWRIIQWIFTRRQNRTISLSTAVGC
jgi:hypothetical protein